MKPSARAIGAPVFRPWLKMPIESLYRRMAKLFPTMPWHIFLIAAPASRDRPDMHYRLIFSTTRRTDLANSEYCDVAALPRRMKECRIGFMNGAPKAIDDTMFEKLAAILRNERLGWIAVLGRYPKTAVEEGRGN